MDFNWLFHLGTDNLATCTDSDFPISMKGVQCNGLHQVTSANNISDCRNACCGDSSCGTYQWCPANANGCKPASSCWIGKIADCKNNTGWQSMGRPTPAPPVGPAMRNYNDSTWDKKNVPNDYVIEQTFSPHNEKSHGYLPKNISWYRKHFSLDKSMINTSIWIDFDGIYRDSDHYINSVFLGNHQSGYTSFRWYINNNSYNLSFDGNNENVVAIKVDPTHDEGWWYEGGGIYRHVWLNSANYLHVIPWGVYINYTVDITDNSTLDNKVQAIVQTNITNDRTMTATFSLKTDIIDADSGSIVATNTMKDLQLNANQYEQHAQVFELTNVKLWSLDKTSMYYVNSTIIENNKETDQVETRFGFRKTTFTVNDGFYLNNKFVKIKGFCNHQDFAGCGTALPDRVNRFRVEHLKEQGGNAWRMSHNPPNPELLSFTDDYGYLVWDENRNFANNSQYLTDQADMIMRDRNHPSIIIWSICNEGGCMQGSSNGANVGKMFESVIHFYDTMRPISAAMNADWGDSLSTVLDIQGINYNYGEYDKYHSSHPNQPIISSESCSTETDRKEYSMNATTGHVSAYSTTKSSAWGCWQPVIQRKFVMGSMDWTGFDYKGEPTPYGWPDVNSHFGVTDIAGFPKDNYFYYKAWFDQNTTTIYTVPSHWNFDSKYNGKEMKIWIYSNAKYIELYLNNKSITPGKQEMIQYNYLEYNVNYEQGTLMTIGYDENNKTIGNKIIQTTSTPNKIKLIISYPSDGIIMSDGQDVVMLEAQILDSNNLFIGTASNLLKFSIVSGPGVIYGVGNGDPSCHQPDKGSERNAFHGRARLIVQSLLNQAGTIKIMAESDGLTSDSVSIQSKAPKKEMVFVK